MTGIDLTYLTAHDAARALYLWCRMRARAPEDVTLWNPFEAMYAGYGAHWRVIWDDGPYNWGASLVQGLPADRLGRTHPEIQLVGGAAWHPHNHTRQDVGFVTQHTDTVMTKEVL